MKVLEARRAAWEAEHIPARDVACMVLDVLGVVRREAGDEAADRVARRVLTLPLPETHARRGRP